MPQGLKLSQQTPHLRWPAFPLDKSVEEQMGQLPSTTVEEIIWFPELFFPLNPVDDFFPPLWER